MAAARVCGSDGVVVPTQMSASTNSWRGLPAGAQVLVGLVTAAGTACLLQGAIHQSSKNIAEFICYLGIAILASRLRVTLPGITGTLSVSFLFILVGIAELGYAEAMTLGAVAMIAQSLYPARPTAIQLTFNVCAGSFSTALGYFVYHNPFCNELISNRPLLLCLTATVYFIVNAGSIATVISLSEGKPLRDILVDCYFWSFPYYLVGAGIAGAISWFNHAFNWETSLLFVPAIYLIYRSYRLYLGKLEDEKRHVEEMANLHLRTIEALALAIEAKDHTTHEHLQRVRIYAIEVAKELGIKGTELEALHAAALLHDIGKLAVPEHIISKPGRLTPEEFEKMKIHPIVGAEILEQVDFPYPVVPIVRAHHEKWDGSGYPYGLAGEAIPIGARILAAVDCLDALASDRQYRKALPLDEAMAKVVADAGRSFDPQVVAILHRRYIELEKMANEQPLQAPPKLSTDVKVERGSAPAAGFETSAGPDAQGPGAGGDSTALLLMARRLGQEIIALNRRAGSSLSAEDILSLLAVRLKNLVPHDSMAVYCPSKGGLRAEFVGGDNFRLFSSLKIPHGEGLSGWVAQNHKSILNGNPSVEPGYLNDPTKFSTLRSALAVPLEGSGGVAAVLALYRADQDAFTADDLLIVEALTSGLGTVIESAGKAKSSAVSAGTS